MERFPEQTEEFKKRIEREVAKEVIKRHLAIFKMGDDAKKVLGKVKVSNAQTLFNALDPQLRAEILPEVRREIEEGKINLDDYIAKLSETRKGGEER